jgi:putative flavoprotein involved in K+ transport
MTIDAVVIGGGQAGLGASYHLARRGIEHVVLERDQVAESWRSQRWDSFAMNTPNWMNRLPGEADVAEPRDAFATGSAFAQHLQDYADRERLPIRTGMDVGKVTNRPDGTFLLTAQHGGGEVEIETRHVIAASGIQRVPRIPAIASELPDAVQQLHTSSYRNPTALPAGAVLVVGSAQSGVQVVEDLLDAGRTVYLCTSAVARSRRRHRGRDFMEWLAAGGFFDIPVDRLPDPRIRFARQPVVSGTGRFGHSVSLQSLAERGVTLLGRPREIQGDRWLLDDTVGANIAFADQKSAEINAEVQKAIDAGGGGLHPLEPDPADEPHPDPMSVRSPADLDLDAAGVGTVIWATGVGGDLSYLPSSVFDPDGAPVHQRGVTAVPGIYFLGFPWLWTRKSGIILGVDEDAKFIADRVAERLTGIGRPHA